MSFFNKPLYARDYRMAAEEKCNKHASNLAIIYLVYVAVVLVASVLLSLPFFQITVNEETAQVSTSWGSVLQLFYAGHLIVGMIIICSKLYNDTKPEVNDLFAGFKNYGNILGVYILQQIFIALWSMLFIIPGIIKTYSYAMALYIQNDNPNKPINECITESRRMMDGNKWKLFCLEFSYIGWFILCVFTCGILTLWVAPKYNYARYLFYLKVSGKGYKDELLNQEQEAKTLEVNNEEKPLEEVKQETEEYSILDEIDKKFESIE
jgi:uncharacterized membrane protein